VKSYLDTVMDRAAAPVTAKYADVLAAAGARQAVEESDCLLSIGYRPIDLTTGDFTASLPAATIHVRGHSVDIGEDNYQAVTLREVCPASPTRSRRSPTARRASPRRGRRRTVAMATGRPS
jgi:indolepyruvate decarboxylase